MEADLAAAKAKAVEQVEQVEEVEQVEQVEQVDQVEQVEQVEEVEQVEQVDQVEQVEDGELDEDDEDESDGIDCEFEGVFYTRDKEDNTVYNDQCAEVGAWESFDDMIVFNKFGKRFHNHAKAQLAID